VPDERGGYQASGAIRQIPGARLDGKAPHRGTSAGFPTAAGTGRTASLILFETIAQRENPAISTIAGDSLRLFL